MSIQTLPPAPQPATDDEARMRAFQIVGSDIPFGQPEPFSGDWQQALKDAATRWTARPTGNFARP